MKSPRDKGFYIYKDGTPMLVEDLIEALRTAISSLAKMIVFDLDVPTDFIDKNLKRVYQRQLEVLEKIKESYELAKAMATKPKMRPVKGRRK